MKGWILLENGEKQPNGYNAIQVFKTKNDLFDYYEGTLGDNNTIQRVTLTDKTEGEEK